ncbi:MAG: hypothetical protein A2600_02460 [Candidatus Lambdaproteobacteria bacterium RIFOXYD1_FULL_56_27]|uniref:Uncharacterized protein n=1 Tax=Candidatus Lambdaproteobacteria bacterium RIFOXYD2_FULL_56_26 TaxID=1817773 RepID=A0A1F6H2M1_9PROT|nr:MAG: hypothetical protein A2426_09500 [Candidatus Lambdaproteobacteria bacterium RIFOXYC1_FULL_56_13]OGH04641.1 MAG: hypothetical protein A2557_06525 [Candidatus Lambdaproteobacteria bacterium RIFOXYD2_FULL_56_26]OGH09105.1 MAG: hypothetical protein A2600_02460 [Candidatus Lambdaproteobacteria bacterium RIFOXYD1_FULL_56_27]
MAKKSFTSLKSPVAPKNEPTAPLVLEEKADEFVQKAVETHPRTNEITLGAPEVFFTSEQIRRSSKEVEKELKAVEKAEKKRLKTEAKRAKLLEKYPGELSSFTVHLPATLVMELQLLGVQSLDYLVTKAAVKFVKKEKKH